MFRGVLEGDVRMVHLPQQPTTPAGLTNWFAVGFSRRVWVWGCTQLDRPHVQSKANWGWGLAVAAVFLTGFWFEVVPNITTGNPST